MTLTRKWNMWRHVTLLAVVVCCCCCRQASPAHDVQESVKEVVTDHDGDDKTVKSAFDHNPVCPIGCFACSVYNGCVTCQRKHFLFLQWFGMRQVGSCLSHCPQGYFGIKKRGHGKCLKCSLDHCESCYNNTTCTQCERSFYLVEGRCAGNCPEHLPYASESGQCQRQVDCEVGVWTQWSPCNRKGMTCGFKYGLQTRTRPVLHMPSLNGIQCPVIMQIRKCRMKHRFCEDTESNRSDLSKAFGWNEINWKRLGRFLIKHRKRKQSTDLSKAKNANKNKDKKNKNKKTKQAKDDILKQQATSTPLPPTNL